MWQIARGTIKDRYNREQEEEKKKKKKKKKKDSKNLGTTITNQNYITPNDVIKRY
jgi:hypothetical protein